jgi:pimeloyl-ACP methyl ester carboxylesterase
MGRSTGKAPQTIDAIAEHALAFMDGLSLERCDILGYSLGGMIAQHMALERPSLFRRLILAGTAPRGGEDIMHLEKPSLARYFQDPALQGYARLQKLFFVPSPSSQTAGEAFLARLSQRRDDRDQAPGPEVAAAQIAAFRDWEHFGGDRFADLQRIQHATLVVNGVHDEMIPVRNSYWLSENLPNAVLLIYPDSGHGALFQFHESFTRQATTFLNSDSALAPY